MFGPYGHGFGTAYTKQQVFIPFRKSADEIISETLKSAVYDRQQKLVEIQSFRKLQGIQQSSMQLTSKDVMDREFSNQDIQNIRGSSRIRMQPHPFHPMEDMMHEMHEYQFEPHSEYETIKTMQWRLQSQMRRLDYQINRFKFNSKPHNIEMIKMNIKNRYTPEFSQIKNELKKQYEKFKKLNIKITSPAQLIDIIDSSLSRSLNTLKKKIADFFQKCHETITKMKGKHENQLNKIEGELKKIQTNFFDFTRTKLIKMAATEQLPPYSGVSIKQHVQRNSNEAKKQEIDVCKDGISSKYGNAFNQKSFTGLHEMGWLHNSVIDNYIQYLRQTRNYNDPNKGQCAIFTSSQSKLFDDPESFRFISGPIFTKYKRIGLVFNVNNDHWFFIGVIPHQTRIIVYDSINKSSTKYHDYCQKLRNFIRKEKEIYNVPQSFEFSQTDEDTTPKQTNGADCGIHVIRNLTYFLEGMLEPDNKIKFRTSDNSQIRMALYHFMAYLLHLARKNNPVVRYDWLEYASRSLMVKPRKDVLWGESR